MAGAVIAAVRGRVVRTYLTTGILIIALGCGCGGDDGALDAGGDAAGDFDGGASGGDGAAVDGAVDGPVGLEVLSSRAEMVTGGDALVALRVGPEVDFEDVRVLLEGRDVTASFHAFGGEGRYVARVEGLAPGENRLVATYGTGSVEIVLRDHPITGPVLSGPHEEPFYCTTEAHLLGPATDEDCSAETIVGFLYKTTGGMFATLADPTMRPADIAQTTTSTGAMLDYIVRAEVGVINRAIYWTVSLYDPAAPAWEPWSPSPAWNGRVVYWFGGGLGTGHVQGDPSFAISLNDFMLGQGYALLHASLNTLGTNGDDVLSAETAMMVKEHFVEHFGVPVYTVGFGGSGGSIQQHLIADNYPGILDGIIPSASYPDVWTVLPEIIDCALLLRYFESNAALWPDDEARRAVTGYASIATCQAWAGAFGNLLDPSSGCLPGVPATEIYDAATNPGGIRCTVHDHQVNVFGVDPATGFARRPYDNAGIVYGRGAFEAGAITAEQLLDLNAEIGGLDADGVHVPERTRADPEAIRRAYETGRVLDGGNGLAAIPIIDVRPYLDPAGDIHDAFRTLTTRARLLRANGDTDNHVAMIASPDVFALAAIDAFQSMDAWLSALAADADPDRRAAVRRARPAELGDRCYVGAAPSEGLCPETLVPHASPRRVAGAPIRNDVIQCALVPVEPARFPSLSATQLGRMREIFPLGVCDWEAPPPNRVDHGGTWQTF